ncbi:MAG TPA: preprotein translocase subunit SecE [Tissierellaceae bacterium]
MTTKNKEKGKASNYFKGVRAEMKKVIWPSKKELISYTGVVIFVSAIVSIIVYILDFLIQGGLRFIL